MKIYISGKITGLDPKEAMANFTEASNQIKAKGNIPVNPIAGGINFDLSWNNHMLKDIETLMQCDAIFLLDNWIYSAGSRIEKYIAQEKGMIILYASSKAKEIVIETIRGAVETVTGIQFSDFSTKSRRREWFFARVLFVYNVYNQNIISNIQLGDLVNRSYSNINHCVKTYNNEVKVNKDFRQLAMEVLVEIGNKTDKQ